MRHSILTALLVSLTLINTPYAAKADITASQDNAANKGGQLQKPLIVIRFTENDIPYDRALKKVVSHALRTKPNTFFDIVSVVPETKSSSANNAHQQNANFHATQVSQKLGNLGVRQDRMRTNSQTSTLINADEIHIFVR